MNWFRRRRGVDPDVMKETEQAKQSRAVELARAQAELRKEMDRHSSTIQGILLDLVPERGGE